MIENKVVANFPKQAAKASWIVLLLALGMMVWSSSAMKSPGSHLSPMILGGVIILLFVVGIVSGIISLFGIKKYGKKGILAPAITGILLNMIF